jgi:hypothetical protein
MSSEWFSERTANFFLDNVKLMVVFTTEAGCVHCAVQMKFFNMMQVNNSSYKVER